MKRAKAILKHLALAMVDGLASELHAMKGAAPGGAKQPERQQWFIPFTQPTAAVFKLKHSKGKKANVRDEYKAFLLLEFGMVESGKYPGSKAELVAHYQLQRSTSITVIQNSIN